MKLAMPTPKARNAIYEGKCHCFSAKYQMTHFYADRRHKHLFAAGCFTRHGLSFFAYKSVTRSWTLAFRQRVSARRTRLPPGLHWHPTFRTRAGFVCNSGCAVWTCLPLRLDRLSALRASASIVFDLTVFVQLCHLNP